MISVLLLGVLCVCLLIDAKSIRHHIVEHSCLELQLHGYTMSGEYRIETTAGNTIDVYCEMGLNGGGYTFINPKYFPILTDADLQVMSTNKSSFLMRLRRSTDTSQPFAVLRQLPQYEDIPLKLGLRQNVGYTPPVNINSIDMEYVYYGFLPVAKAENRDVQGLRVNGASVTFTNCDSNPNSYFALFPNFAEREPSSYLKTASFPFCDTLFGSTILNPSRRVMPTEYFMFAETHWGGCGCYWQTDSRTGIHGIAIGFR